MQAVFSSNIESQFSLLHKGLQCGLHLLEIDWTSCWRTGSGCHGGAYMLLRGMVKNRVIFVTTLGLLIKGEM